MSPSVPVLLRVHVVLVFWDMLLLHPQQLENLCSQSASVFNITGSSVVVHLVNNNPSTRSKVDGIVSQPLEVIGVVGQGSHHGLMDFRSNSVSILYTTRREESSLWLLQIDRCSMER